VRVNDRAILIHRYLSADGHVVHSSAAAARRVVGVLARMHGGEIATASPPARTPANQREREHRLRLLLGSFDERMEALSLIWTAQDLQDVALLCDLIELPPAPDASPDEGSIMVRILDLWSLQYTAASSPYLEESLYLNWWSRYALLMLDGAKGRLSPLYELLGRLLFRYRDNPAAWVPVARLAPGEPLSRETVVRANLTQPVQPLPQYAHYELWRDQLAERKLFVSTAPAAERHYWADQARRQLLSPSVSDRMGALATLAVVGNLHDVGMICDLLTLPHDDWEGAAMLAVLHQRAWGGAVG
jgi:hypothetical protein